MIRKSPFATTVRAGLIRALALGVAFAFWLAPAAAQTEISGIDPVARRIDPHTVGYNSDYYYVTNPWSETKRREAARNARPSMLRYPGGTSSSYWDAYHARIFRDVSTIDSAYGNPAG